MNTNVYERDPCKRQPGWCRFGHLYGNIDNQQTDRLKLIGEIEDFQKETRSIDPGALVHIKLTSKVGVNLDAYANHSSSLKRIVTYLQTRDDQFWINRASEQIRLAQFRFAFRPLFLDGKFQLPLPQPNQWKFVIHGNATRDRSINGHDCIYVTYSWSTYILTDFKSPGISEPRLRRIGGKWAEPFILPIDPYYLLQRTGYACMDEGEFPIPSVHPERVEWFYDDTCEAEDPYEPSLLVGCRQCHCSHTVRTSCVAALKTHIGMVHTSFIFTRLPWNTSLADKIRQQSVPSTTQHPNGADQKMLTGPLRDTLIQYKYFDSNACELDEPCIGDLGWRRLLLFDSTEENIGGAPLTFGQVYLLNENDEQEPAEIAHHGLYQYDPCHRHYHFKYYGTFTVGNGNHVNGKRGFCIQSTGRQANAEWSPIWSPFYNCSYQGNTAGWTDTYQAGVPCQWVDITAFDTKESAISTTLSAKMNPDGMLCEGELILNKKGNFIWVATNYTASNGETVYKQKCKTGQNPSTLANNFEQVQITIPKDGYGYITEPCNPSDQHMGAQRNCGFKLKTALNRCLPGESVQLECKLRLNSSDNITAIPYVVRICESSHVLKAGTACDYNTALQNKVVRPFVTQKVRFQCPKYRDVREIGGLYSIYTTALFPQLKHPSTSITCLAMN